MCLDTFQPRTEEEETETTRKLKAFGDALKFPQSTNRGGKEERATVTPEKKQPEWQNRELLKLEVAAAERQERQRFREEEMALQAKRRAEDEEKAEEEEEEERGRRGETGCREKA